ncbi:MAG: DUF975 family protein [Chitinispirillales bacterium]|jgi:uncharacterized membrane protein|nr:DUF975 family protein [Chitinispirillales bacterium]
MNYNVLQSNKELRAQARGQLRGMWGQMFLAFFLFSVITTLPYSIAPYYAQYGKIKTGQEKVSANINSIIENRSQETSLPAHSGLTSKDENTPENESISADEIGLISDGLYSSNQSSFPKLMVTMIIILVLFIIGILISGPFNLGLTGLFLKRIRGEATAVKNIFDGFKCFAPSALLGIFMMVFIVLWCLLLLVPGIIKGLSYSMSYFIMNDNPEIKPLEVLKRSKDMMKGQKWKLFKLYLSFIGWFFLALLPMVIIYAVIPDPASNFTAWVLLEILSLPLIGFFLVAPYVWLSVANFYENLKMKARNAG